MTQVSENTDYGQEEFLAIRARNTWHDLGDEPAVAVENSHDPDLEFLEYLHCGDTWDFIDHWYYVLSQRI